MRNHNKQHDDDGQQARRAGVAARLSAVRHALSGGRKGQPLPVAAPAEPAARERRTLPTSIEEVGFTLDKPRTLHHQKVSVPEHAGRPLPHELSIVASFDLDGLDGKPMNFSVLRQLDGRMGAGPVAVMDGYPSQWAMPVTKANTPTITVLPTSDLDILRQMNNPSITEQEFAALRSQVRVSGHIVPGGSLPIGRGGAFGDMLGPQVSSQHMTIDFTPRQEGSGMQDAMVVIADHSLNGTENLVVHSRFGLNPQA